MSFVDRLRRSRSLTRLFFGVDVPVRTVQGHWDFTTFVLKKGLDRFVQRGMKVLEVGTGEAGVLATYAAGSLGSEVTAVDISDEVLSSARKVSEHNGVRLKLQVSDLLSALPPDASFDLVVFNPPYVPADLGRRLGLPDKEPARVWDGGADGADVLRRFLAEAARFDGLDTLILVGFNTHRVGEKLAVEAAEAQGLQVASKVSLWWNPSVVYALRKRDKSFMS